MELPHGPFFLTPGLTLVLRPLLSALLALQQPDSLTLAEAFARARDTRPAVTAAAATVERARGAQRLGALIPNPTAQLEADGDAPTRRATLTQSLAWLPRRGADLAAGRAGVARARADSVQRVADVGREVGRAFFGALAAASLRTLADEQRTIADSLGAVAARRAQAGDISDLERDQVLQEAARARLAASQAREAERVARAELARAVAWEAGRGAEPRPVGRLDADLDTSAVASDAAAVDDLPQLESARADSVAAAARLRAARIARIPVPGLVAGREWGGGDNIILGLALPVPLWNRGGEVVAEARGAAAERAAALAEVRLGLTAQLAQARVRLVESAVRARFARDTLLPEAQRVRAGAARLYESGRTNVVAVLDALRVERDVGRETLAALLAFQQARSDLIALLGRWP